ncbi:MAG: phage tail protein [Deltaproteobacteria bacterium]|nr:phage tail protein [Deltaproteobacteria bacterium]
MASNQQPRTYAAAHFALELDGKKDVGLFRSIEGGGVKADVMTYQQGAHYDKWRSIGKPKFEDIKVQVGMAMSEPFYAWISKFFDGIPDRKNGAIVAADFYYKERARREFTNAMIKEMTFPKLDATDDKAVYMSVALAVEGIVFKKGEGTELQQNKGHNAQKLWTARNFRLSLDGFEQACKRVVKIDSFTIKQNILEYHQGGFRAPTKMPSQIDFPTVSFYLPEADAAPFMKRFTERGINGERRGHAAQKAGMIQTFDTEKKELFTLEFFEADIVGVTPDKSDAGSEDFKLVKIDLFTEKMKFTYASPPELV